MRRAALAALCVFAVNGYGFEEKPWFGNFLEVYLDSSYAYSRFDSVANSTHRLKSPSNNNLLTFDLGFTPLEDWDVAAEIEFAHTPRQSWGRRSAAMQIRKALMNDISCDPISLTVGASVRQTAFVSLRDISCPYSARWDFEVHSAIGKEWITGSNWSSRLYGVGALGQGNTGSPWTRAEVFYQIQKPCSHTWEFFGLGYWGFGHRHSVNINHFHGWGSYDHSSIDLGLGYIHELGVWGHLRFDYAHRFYAKVYPRGTNTFIVAYHLPFSFF